MKKKLLAIMAFLGIVMTTLFIPGITGNAMSGIEAKSEDTIIPYSSDYTDIQIFNYLQSQNKRYDTWLFVDSLKKGTTYSNCGKGGQAFGSSFTFQKGRVYVFDGYQNKYDSNHDYYNFANYYTDEAIQYVFGNLGFGKFTIKYGTDEDFYHIWYDGLCDEPENDIEQEINERFISMVQNKIYSKLGYVDYSGNSHEDEPRENILLIAECNETFTVNLANGNFQASQSNSYNKECLLLTEYTTDGTAFDMTAPTIGIPSNYIVNVDNMQSQAQILSHVAVIDDTDPNPQLVVKSTNYSQSNRVIGTYQFVVYGIDNMENASIDYTFNVIVADSTKPSNTTFGTITQPNNVQLSPDQIISKFTISDNYSSSDNITKVLVKNDYSTNWTRPGNHEVVCRATDESGNYQDSTGYIQVVDKTNPTNVATNITSQANNVKLSQAELLALFTVSDDVSTVDKITKSILSDTYSTNCSLPGTYQVSCRATDEGGNYKDATASITVIDTTPPTLSGKTIETLYNAQIEDLKSLFIYGDDITSNENLIFEIIKDDYTSIFNRKGNHEVTARITDEAGNSSEESSYIRVVDTIKPVVTAPLEITVGNSSRFTEENLREKIVVEDGYDGIITDYEITDNEDYANNYLTVGRYTRTIKASDVEGNTQTLTITLIVTDTTSPQVFYDKFFIVLTEGESLTDEMIKAYAAQALGVSQASILTLEGEYNSEVVGCYEVSLFMMDGSVQPFTISVGDLIEKEPAKFSWKQLFSNDMSNWKQFDQWPAWSICAWLSWSGIALGAAILAGVMIGGYVVKKKKKK